MAVDDCGSAQAASVEPVAHVRWDDRGGRGLHLLQALADAWGAREAPGGKQVWFALRNAS